MHRLARLSLEHPVATLAWLCTLTLVFAAGVPRVVPEYGYRVLIGDDHPAVVELDAFIARYGGGLPIEIAWECGPGLPCAHVFDTESLAMSEAVASVLQSATRVARVVSPSNAPLLVPRQDGFSVRRFVENGRQAADAALLAERAQSDPSWRNAIVSSDGLVGVITVQPIDSREETSRLVAEAVLDTIAPHEARGFRFHLVGDPIQNLIVGRDLAESTAQLIPFTVLVVAFILWMLSRSLVHVAISLVTMGTALAWTFGLLGWLGWPQDGILEVLAPLILVVGVCDAVHLLSRYDSERRDARPASDLDARAVGAHALPDRSRVRRAERLLRATRELAAPCLLTSLTTAVAFLSFVTSNLATFVRFGSIAAFGVIACLLLSFTLLPLLVMLAPVEKRTREVSETWSVALEAILRTSERRAVPILLATTALLVAFGAGWALHLRVDHDWTESLGEESRVVRAQRFMEDRLARSSSLEVELALPAGTRVELPDTLGRIASLEAWLDQRQGLGSARSVLDVLGRVNRLLHDDRVEFDRAGDSTAANAQMLELAGFDDPILVDQWLSFDRTRARISVGAPEQASSTRSRLLEKVRAHVEEVLPADWEVLLSGRVRMQAEWIESVQATQMRSFPTALALVFVLVASFLRSPRLGLAAMVPALIPTVLMLGAMGWLGMSLDVGRAMIAAILLGIAVDDAIHILQKYASVRRAGHGPHDAIRAAILYTGRAVTTTSVALALGFLTLMISAWQSIASFGFYAALAIVGALVATLFVLPALVFAFTRGGSGSEPRTLTDAAAPRRRPSRASSVALLAVCGIACASCIHIAGGGPRRELPCWLLPSGHVLPAAGPGTCPLRFLDQVRWISIDGRRTPFTASVLQQTRGAGLSPLVLGVARGGEERRVEVTLVDSSRSDRALRLLIVSIIALALAGTPLLLLRRSRSPVVLPLALLYTAMGVTVLAAFALRDSPLMSRTAIVALVFGTAACVHLGMVFPEEQRSARLSPRIGALPYAFAFPLAAVATLLLDDSPVLWPSFLSLLVAVSAGAWLTLVAASAYASRTSASTIARYRAKLVCLPTLLIPLVLSAPGWWPGPTDTFRETAPWGAALLMPLPLAFAVSRFNAFDLGWRALQASVRLLQLASAAAVTALLTYAAIHREAESDTLLLRLCAAAFLGLAICETFRRPTLRYLEARLAPRPGRLRERLAAYIASAAEPRSEEAAARHALYELSTSLRASEVTILLEHTLDPRLAEAFRMPEGATFDTALAAEATAHLWRRATPVWVLDASEDAEQAPLLASGVSVVATLEHGRERLGAVVLGSTRDGAPYAAAELRFLEAVAARAAVAIADSRTAECRIRREREAEGARLAVDLMHDIGKDLGWIQRSVDRLLEQPRSPEGLSEGLSRVQRLTRSLADRITSFARDATSTPVRPAGVVRVDELLERTVKRACERYGESRIRESRNSTTRGASCHGLVGRAITLVIDEVARRSESSQPIRVDATLGENASLTVAVSSEASAHQPEGQALEAPRAIAEALGGRLSSGVSMEAGALLTMQLRVPTVDLSACDPSDQRRDAEPSDMRGGLLL